MDQFWTATKTAMDGLRGARAIYAPTEMQGPTVTENYSAIGDGLDADEAIVLHKGRLDEFDAKTLKAVRDTAQPVFANEVFVIYAGAEVASGHSHKILPEHVEGFARAADILLARGYERPKKFELTVDPLAQMEFKHKPSVYLGNGVVLSTLYDGQKIFLDGDDISLTPHLAIDGYWETWITKVFLKSLKKGMTVVDIGCNCGYYSLLAARAIGPQGSLTCIDANPRMTSLVDKSLAVNGYTGFARTETVAVAKDKGTVQLKVPKLHKGSASIVETSFQAGHLQDDYEIVNVPAAPLDAILHDPRVDILKIDAEGAEPMIIAGAMSVLRNSPDLRIIMEFAPAFMGEEQAYALLDTLRSEGFHAEKITHDAETVPFDRCEKGENHADLLLTRHP